MKKMALAAAAVAFLMTGAASAADMAVKARPAPIPPPVFSWTGCYIGGSVGWIGGSDRYDTGPSGAYIGLPPATLAAASTSYKVNGNGVTGGGQAGCNYQTGAWVFGIEADINGSSLRESAAIFIPATGGGGFVALNQTLTKDLDWWGTARARLGFAVDRVFFYGTGGVAFAHYKSSYAISALDGSTFAGSDNWTNVGWVAGAGIEYAFAPNWTVKAEYLHLDLGSRSYNSINTSDGGGPASPTFTFTANIRLREEIVRVGINYKFGGPVVAKY